MNCVAVVSASSARKTGMPMSKRIARRRSDPAGHISSIVQKTTGASIASATCICPTVRAAGAGSLAKRRTSLVEVRI